MCFNVLLISPTTLEFPSTRIAVRVRSVEPFRLEEIAVPAGGAWGSTYVDKNFELFIEQLISTPHFKVFRGTPYYIDLMEAWEKVKLNFKDADAAPTRLNLSLITDALGEEVNIILKERIDLHNSRHNKGLTHRGDLVVYSFQFIHIFTFSLLTRQNPLGCISGRSILLMPPALIKEFHEVVVKKTVECVLRLSLAHKPKYVFMVGGFSESDHLQKQLAGMLTTSTRKVIIPDRPGLAGKQLFTLFTVVDFAYVRTESYCDELIPTNYMHDIFLHMQS